MKTKSYFLLLLVIGITISSCTKSINEESENKTVFLNDIELLTQLGYDLTDLTECTDYYLIKPDIIISKDRLNEIRETPLTRMQYRKANGILDIRHQTVYLNPVIDPRYEPEFVAAIEEWNSLENTNLQFIIENNNYDAANISMSFNGANDTNFISVERPYNGSYGKHISINLSNYPTSPNAIPYMQIKYLIMHALGHLVGLEHVYGQDDGTPSTTWDLYPNTDKFDAKSIMRSEDYLNQNRVEIWSGFSVSDKKAISIIYPTIDDSASTKEILFKDENGKIINNNILKIGDLYTFTPKYVSKYCTNPTYSISIQNINGRTEGYTYELISFKPTYNIKFVQPGKYRITVKVENASFSTTFSQIYSIYAQEPWFEGSEIAQLGEIYNLSFSCWNLDFPNTKINLTITETLYNDPQYTIISQTNNNLKIRFNEPGQYEIKATMQNGPSEIGRTYYINIFYHPEFVYSSSEKRIYFYSDETHSQPLNLAYRVPIYYIDDSSFILLPMPVTRSVPAEFKTYAFANVGATYVDVPGKPKYPPIIPPNFCKQNKVYIPIEIVPLS